MICFGFSLFLVFNNPRPTDGAYAAGVQEEVRGEVGILDRIFELEKKLIIINRKKKKRRRERQVVGFEF